MGMVSNFAETIARKELQLFSNILSEEHVFVTLNKHQRTLLAFHNLFTMIEQGKINLWCCYDQKVFVGCVWGEVSDNCLNAHIAFKKNVDVQKALTECLVRVKAQGVQVIKGVIDVKNRASNLCVRRFGCILQDETIKCNGELYNVYLKEL